MNALQTFLKKHFHVLHQESLPGENVWDTRHLFMLQAFS